MARKRVELDGKTYEGTRPHLILESAKLDELTELAEAANTTLSGLISVIVLRWLSGELAWFGPDTLRRIAKEGHYIGPEDPDVIVRFP